MSEADTIVQEKTLEPMLVAGIRMRGKYSDCGKAFSRIGWRFGRHICGKPLLLLYDNEYREHDADFEACMPIRRGADVAGINVRECQADAAFACYTTGRTRSWARATTRFASTC